MTNMEPLRELLTFGPAKSKRTEKRPPKRHPTVVWVNSNGQHIGHKRTGRMHEIRANGFVGTASTIDEAKEILNDAMEHLGGSGWKIQKQG